MDGVVYVDRDPTITGSSDSTLGSGRKRVRSEKNPGQDQIRLKDDKRVKTVNLTDGRYHFCHKLGTAHVPSSAACRFDLHPPWSAGRQVHCWSSPLLRGSNVLVSVRVNLNLSFAYCLRVSILVESYLDHRGASGGRMQRVGSQNTTIPCTKNADFQTLLYQNMGACQNMRYIRAIQLMINILSMTGII